MFQGALVIGGTVAAFSLFTYVMSSEEDKMKMLSRINYLQQRVDRDNSLLELIRIACNVKKKPCTITHVQHIDDDEVDFVSYNASLRDRKRIAVTNLVLAQNQNIKYDITCQFEERQVGVMSLDTDVIATYTIQNKN